jgi:hypothetical protein
VFAQQGNTSVLLRVLLRIVLLVLQALWMNTLLVGYTDHAGFMCTPLSVGS